MKPNKQEWDKFDEDCLKRAVWYIENPAPSVVKDTNLALWLKLLPGRFNLQPKQEWSEEDKTMLKVAIAVLRRYSHDDVANFLKSLRSSWKPTDEQMKWLKDVIETVHMPCRQQVPLESLYNDLLKLT
jgi:predicted P-loop ATPase